MYNQQNQWLSLSYTLDLVIFNLYYLLDTYVVLIHATSRSCSQAFITSHCTRFDSSPCQVCFLSLKASPALHLWPSLYKPVLWVEQGNWSPTLKYFELLQRQFSEAIQMMMMLNSYVIFLLIAHNTCSL